MEQRTLKQMIKNSRRVFSENRRYYSNNSCLFFNKKTPLLLGGQTFIDLLNDGATKLEFRGTGTWGEAKHYEYHALYHGREIVAVLENPINEI